MTVSKKKPPTGGGKKGGTKFPRVKLDKAHEYAKILVSKTHTGPQPSTIILPGVFGNAGSQGEIRASALKQYGLLKGTTKDYSATDLARTLNSATEEDVQKLLGNVFLTPKLFKTLFDTFVSGNTTRAKIKAQAGNFKVHPDTLDECVDIFVASAIYAKLASENGDSITFYSGPIASTIVDAQDQDGEETDPQSEDNVDGLEENEDTQKDQNNNGTKKITSRRAASNIDIKIDPSMDPEKLEKLLKVLRKYGQI